MLASTVLAWQSSLVSQKALRPLVQDFIRTRLNAGYDPEYLQQLFDFLVYIISSLEAPARSDSTKKVSHPDMPRIKRVLLNGYCSTHAKFLAS